jgi:hypothetical protein
VEITGIAQEIQDILYQAGLPKGLASLKGKFKCCAPDMVDENDQVIGIDERMFWTAIE